MLERDTVLAAALATAAKQITLLQAAMAEIQDAANQETKSSAGDKYETGRSMLQLEKDKLAQQLEQAVEVHRQLVELPQTSPGGPIAVGHLISTSEGWYLLAAPLGKVTVYQQPVFVLSPAAPLGKMLLGKTIGDEIRLRDRQLSIVAIH